MTAPLTGGCQCGAVRYTLALDTLPAVYACHCHQCQRWSGSAFSLQLLVPEEALTATGPVIAFERATGNRISRQRVCGECHSRIYNTNTRRPGVAVVRAGTLDRSEALECRAHIFSRFQQAWFVIPAGVPSWPEAPPPGALIAALDGAPA